MKIKVFFLLLLTSVFLSAGLNAQQVRVFTYSYDESGNDVLRNVDTSEEPEPGIPSLPPGFNPEWEAEMFQIAIYPNPTDGLFSLEIRDLNGDPVKEKFPDSRIAIVDLQGRMVYSQNVLKASQRIDISKQTAGYYYVLIHVNGKIQAGIVIKK